MGKTALADNTFFYSDWLIIEDNKVIVNPGVSKVDLMNKTVNLNLTQHLCLGWVHA